MCTWITQVSIGLVATWQKPFLTKLEWNYIVILEIMITLNSSKNTRHDWSLTLPSISVGEHVEQKASGHNGRQRYS